jgi:hypothetical protein
MWMCVDVWMCGCEQIEIDVVDFHKFDLIGATDSPSSMSFRITSRGGRDNLIRHFLAFKKASGMFSETMVLLV